MNKHNPGTKLLLLEVVKCICIQMIFSINFSIEWIFHCTEITIKEWETKWKYMYRYSHRGIIIKQMQFSEMREILDLIF